MESYTIPTPVTVLFPVPQDRVEIETERILARIKVLDDERSTMYIMLRALQAGCKHKGDPCTFCRQIF